MTNSPGSTQESAPATPRDTVRPKPPSLWPGALAIPAAGLIFELVAVKAASSDPYRLPDFTELGFWTWMALPFVLAGVLMGIAAGQGRLAFGLTIGLAVAIGAAGVWGYLDARARPDASFILLSGPFVQLVAAMAVGVAVGALRGRRAGRSDPPPPPRS